VSYEDDLVRRIRQESSGARSEAARKAHLLKMGFAGAIVVICLGLFAFEVLSGVRGKGQLDRLKQQQRAGRAPAPREAGWTMLMATGPEMAALGVGSLSGIWFLFLLMRLRRFD